MVVQIEYEDLPGEVVDQAKRCLIDWMGVALSGAESPTARILSDLVRDLSGKKQASVIRPFFKTTVLHASLVNGSISHVLDFDDHHPETFLHVSAFLVPAALAGGELKEKNGKDILTAFVTGFEAVTRVSLGAGKGPLQLEMGWHPTSTLGRIGAAVCFGKLLKLNPEKMSSAIGISGTQAAGLRKVFGTMAKHFHAGKAAHDGVLAALLASRGFSAPMDILEGKDGLCQTLSGQFDQEQILNGFGERFEILNNCFKPYPSCGQTHSVISACLEIHNKSLLSPSDVEKIICEVNPVALEVAGKRNPKDKNEAKFSLYYCAARGLMGDVSSQAFVNEEIERKDVQELMKMIEVRANPSFKIENAHVEVIMLDGRQFESKVDHLKGGPHNPMRDEEIDAKFLELVSPIFRKAGAARNLLEVLRTFEGEKHTDRLMKLLSKSQKEDTHSV